MKDSRTVVGLDIGTTKITTIIGEQAADGSIDIIGQGTAENEGIDRGAVVNFEHTVQAIRESVHRAERVAGVRVDDVYATVSGAHAKAITSRGLAAVRRGSEISQDDVDRAIENAGAVRLDPNLEVLHLLPQDFEVDGQKGIRNAVGMQGVRLEVDVHIVAGTVGPLMNLRRCVQEAGYRLNGWVLHAYASGIATVMPSERNQSILVADIGGNSTDIAIFKRGHLAHSSSVPVGADHVSSDMAQLLHLTPEEADSLKKRYGVALPYLADSELSLQITTPAGRKHTVAAQDISRIIKARMSEIFDLVRDEAEVISSQPFEALVNQVVITGGGSGLEGSAELARDHFRLPVRVGTPVAHVGGLRDIVNGPEYAAGVGLVLFGNQELLKASPPSPEPEEEQPQPPPQPPQQQGGLRMPKVPTGKRPPAPQQVPAQPQQPMQAQQALTPQQQAQLAAQMQQQAQAAAQAAAAQQAQQQAAPQQPPQGNVVSQQVLRPTASSQVPQAPQEEEPESTNRLVRWWKRLTSEWV